MFSYVFLTSHVEIVKITECLEGFRHARAAAAAMCTLCHFLQGMVALAGAQTLLKQFEVSAKVALEAPFDRNVKKPLGLEGFRHARAAAARMCAAWYYLTGMAPLGGGRELLS